MSVKLFNTHIHAHTEHKAGWGPLNVRIKLKYKVQVQKGGEKTPMKPPLSHHHHRQESRLGIVVILGTFGMSKGFLETIKSQEKSKLGMSKSRVGNRVLANFLFTLNCRGPLYLFSVVLGHRKQLLGMVSHLLYTVVPPLRPHTPLFCCQMEHLTHSQPMTSCSQRSRVLQSMKEHPIFDDGKWSLAALSSLKALSLAPEGHLMQQSLNTDSGEC